MAIKMLIKVAQTMSHRMVEIINARETIGKYKGTSKKKGGRSSFSAHQKN